MPIVKSPVEIFHAADGSPLEDGNIYVGDAGLDPRTNAVQVYWDEALTITATQPIRTLAGRPVNQGSAANIYVEELTVSLRIEDKNNVLIDTDLNVNTGDSATQYIKVPAEVDLPQSIYVGDTFIPNLVNGGLGNNVLLGRSLLSGAFTGTDPVNPDTGYGLTLVGTGIGSQNMTNCRDNEIIGYEAAYYLGNANQLQIIGAKALYCDLTRAVPPNTGAPQAGVVIGTTAHFDGLTGTSQRFVTIGTNAGRENTRAWETVYIGRRAAYHLGDTLYNVAIGASTLGGEVDQSATNTINNVAVGWYTLGALGNGTQNIALGGNAGRAITTGGRNVLIGHGAGSDIATANSAAGANALTTGTHNTLIGNETEVSGPTATYQVAIGSGAAATKNNQIVLGDTGRVHEVRMNGYSKTNVTTVLALPNAATAGAGARMFVSDCTLTASGNFGASTTGTGGGANTVPVFSDGSAWRIG